MTDKIINDSLNKIRLLEATAADVRDVAGATALGAGATQLGATGLNKAGVKSAAKIAGKAAKFIPFAGSAVNAADAVSRAQAGDYVGSAISGAGAVPILSLPAMGIQAVRDKINTGSWLPDDDEIAAAYGKKSPTAVATPKVPPGGDPKVFALQQQLIAKGAKITADGKMGPATQAAMKQFPTVKMAENNEGTTMSESQKIADLRDRLSVIESKEKQVLIYLDESNNVWSEDGQYLGEAVPGAGAVKAAGGMVDSGVGALKTGWNAAKDWGSSLYKGIKGEPIPNKVDPTKYQASVDKLSAQTKGRGANKTTKYTPAEVDRMAKQGAEIAPSNAALKGQKAGQAIRNNPLKTAAVTTTAGAVTGAGVMKALEPGAPEVDTKPEVTPSPAPAPRMDPRPVPAPAPAPEPEVEPGPGGGLSPEEAKELDDLYNELGNTENPEPEVATMLNSYNSLKKGTKTTTQSGAPMNPQQRK